MGGVSIFVHADTRDQAERWLADLCRAHGLVRASRSCQSIGTGRWMVRATPAEQPVSEPAEA